MEIELFTLLSSWLVIIASLLVVFISCIFLYILRMNSRPSSMLLPPNPPRLPIIGNLHQLLRKPRHQALSQLSQQYGPLMQLHIGTKSFLVVSSAAMAKQILKTQDHIFCSRPTSKATKRLTYNYLDIAFSPQSNHRREKRKLLISEFLGPKRAALFHDLLVMEIERMIHSLPPNTAVNLSNMLLATVKEVVCKVAFGKNHRDQKVNGSSWEEILEEAVVMLNGSLGDYFPWFGGIFDWVSGWNSKLEKCFSNLDAYIQMIVDEHHNHILSEISEDDKDFVHRLLELSSMHNIHASDYNRLTKEDVKAIIMDVFTGGIDTTVATMEWAMSEIVRSCRVMQKLQSEIRDHTGRIQKVKELDIKKMRYLKMVVKETLRLHPPAPLLIPHESLSRCQIGGYDIVPGTTAFINAWAIGRDGSIWGDNVCDFYPERFENNVDQVDFEMVPFGGGRRSCPAMNTAPATVELMIANLLYWFDWQVPGDEKNEDLNMEEDGNLIVHKKLPLLLVHTNHRWED